MKRLTLISKTKLRLLALLLCLAAAVPQLMAQTYTVAGSDTQALGASWSPTTTSNNMTSYSGNKYYLLKSVTYSSGNTYEYKITVNNSWNTSYGNNGGGNNASYTVTAGSGFVCYTFDSNTHVPHVVSSLQTVVIAGDDTQALGSSTWNGSNTANSMTTTDGITYTMTKSVDYTSTGTKQCKAVVANTDWYGNSSGGNVSYNILNTGSYTVTYTFNAVTGIVTVDAQAATPATPNYYITGDNGLGLGGFSYQLQNLKTMTYDAVNDIYTYSYNVTSAGTFYFTFADGPGSSWDDFNGNHRYGPTSGNEAVTLGSWAPTQKGGGSYAVTLDAGQVTITFDAANMRYKVDGTEPEIAIDYYVKGDDTNIFPNGWDSGTNTAMTDNGDGTYSWESGQFHLTAGTSYAYKVWGDDGSWHPSGANATFSSNVQGNYTVTINYDSNNGTVTHQLNLVQEDPVYTYNIHVRYTGSENLGNVYLHAWDAAGDKTNWPGTAFSGMTTTEENGHTYYCVTFTSYSQTLGLLFNENGNDNTRTTDLTAQPGTSYFTYGGGSTVSGPNQAADEADPTYDYTIYVRYKGNATPYMYLWEGGSTALLGDFPGTALTDASFTTEVINGYTYYKYTVTGSSYPTLGMILNEGSSDNKTSDLTVNPGTSYYTYGGGSTISGANAEADPAITWFAATSFNNWATEGAQMTSNGDGSYSKTFTGVTLTGNTTYEYKAYGNDGTSEGVWIGNSDGSNAVFTPSVSGTYDVTITLNADGTVSHTLTLIEATSQGSFYIIGAEGLNLTWTYAPEVEMTFDSSTGYYSYSFNVTERGTYGFAFANNNTAPDWETFNNTYRIGPTSGNQNVILNGDWTGTQMAGSSDGGAYQVSVDPGTVTIYFDPQNMRFKVTGNVPTYQYTFYVLPSDADVTPYIYLWGLSNHIFSDAWPGTLMTTTEVLADGNTWHKWTGTVTEDLINAIVNGGNDDTKTKDITHIDPGTYYIKWNTTRQDGEQYNYYELYNIAPAPIYSSLYLHGSYSHEGTRHNYSSSDGTAMKYDANTQNYYLNNVTLSSNATFCFSTLLGDDWSQVGTRYGNGGTAYTDNPDGTNYLGVTESLINKNMPLDHWSETYGEYLMLTAGVYNMLVNPTEHWVKLIKTDHATLSPMNVYLEQTDNVVIDNIQEPGTTYTTEIFSNGETWPLSAYNRKEGEWDPYNGNNHYNVTYMGDTTTVDGKTWWHWQVTASICELFFTRTNTESSHLSDIIQRRSGVLWYTWDEENGETVMTDHTREYFEASANALPTNAVVMEGHYYVYFINTLGWENVYCNAWYNAEGSTYHDGYGRNVQNWPGQPCECVGIDPVTGYEVWRYDFGTIYGTQVPDGILFNDGNPDAQSDVKEQTGDFEYINGGVYDYLGLFDGAYTLNNLIRSAAEEVRYTVSNDLLAVYYDKDAVTRIDYTDISGEETHEYVQGALYAKDLNQYGEKSLKPDADCYDYVYDICHSAHTAGGSQIMDKKTSYDQSNWVKLVISPNYDGGNPVPVASDKRPNLKDYVGHIIPAGSLEVFMTDTINPTAHVLNISMGKAMSYEPNVYVSANFNDTIVYTYTHNEWMPKNAEYNGTYRTRPYIKWIIDEETGEVLRGEVTSRVQLGDEPYKMFYVAPKPQEIAYITWIVYDNLNIKENDMSPYGDYVSGEYQPYTSVARFLPQDPGRFYAPKNWDRSQVIPGEMYESLQYLSEDQLENALGGYGTEYGPYSNGYMQYGGMKVNWSLFDEEKVGMPWWQIFQPGQAYKIMAIIRYARGNGENYEPNECYGPSNGDVGATGQTLNGPRRIDGNGQGDYANMYFTSEYKGLDDSKFIIFPIEASPSSSNGDHMGNVTTVKEVKAQRSVVAVRYYNLMGVESNKPFSGINIVVTTYSDGSRSSRKVLR